MRLFLADAQGLEATLFRRDFPAVLPEREEVADYSLPAEAEKLIDDEYDGEPLDVLESRDLSRYPLALRPQIMVSSTPTVFSRGEERHKKIAGQGDGSREERALPSMHNSVTEGRRRRRNERRKKERGMSSEASIFTSLWIVCFHTF